MHELGIAKEILSCVEEVLRSRPGLRVTQVVVRIGVFQNVEKDSLRFSFHALAEGNSKVAGAELQVQEVPARYFCQACGSRGSLKEMAWACPECGQPKIQVEGGDDLILGSIKGEENGK